MPCIGFRFPRLYVAASLKPRRLARPVGGPHRFPRLYVAASLKLAHRELVERADLPVFRGFMSRPH